MTQRKVRTPRAITQPATVRIPAAGLRRPRGAEAVIMPTAVWLTLIALMISFQAVIMSFTSLTYLLDEVKVLLFFVMGPALMLAAVAAFALREAPIPPRSIGLGLLGYFGITIVSTLLSEYKWIGYFYIVFDWAAAGFFIAAFVVAATRRGSYLLIRYLVLMFLVELLIGYFLIDMFDSTFHKSGINYFKIFLYGQGQPKNATSFYYLLETLKGADDTLQSTILNREFFSNFCCLFVPFALIIGIAPGSTRHPRAWRWIGLSTALLGYLAIIYYCKTKMDWVAISVATAFMVVMLVWIGFLRLRDLALGHTPAWLCGSAILLAVLGWLKAPFFIARLHSAGTSFESRVRIWSGAWRIFIDSLHNVIIGGGPGTFRVYFSAKRSPDYYLHGINNVTTFAHNYLFDVISETGLIGLAIFLFLIGALFFLGLRHALRKENDLYLRLMLIATLTGFLAFCLSNLTSPSGRWVIGATPIWTVMGLLAGLIYQGQHGPFRPAPEPPGHPVHAAAASAAPPPEESARPSHPLFSPNWVVALFLASCLMFGWGCISGWRYFSSNMAYATGLSDMENGTRMYEVYPQNSKDISLENIVYLLKESTKEFNKSIQIDPTNTSAYYKIGSAYTTLAQIYQSLAANAASKGKPEDAQALSIEADRNLEMAKNQYETLIKQYDPDYAEIHYNMGIIYEMWAEYLQRGIASHAIGSEFTPEKVAEYKKESLRHLDLMGKGSNKPEGAYRLGNAYMGMKLYDKARDVYRDASRRSSADQEMYRRYYDAAIQAEDAAGACEALEKLWLLQPQDDEPLDKLVQLIKLKKYDDIEKRVIARLEHINPIHPKLFELKMDQAQRANKPEELLAAAENYIKCGGQDLVLCQLGAQTAENMGRLTDAREIYSRILKIDRDAKTPSGQAARAWLNRPAPAGTPNPAGAPAPAGAPVPARPVPVAPGAINAATSLSKPGTPSGTPVAPAR